jgi:dTDP-4-dehydrorhamnose reductase
MKVLVLGASGNLGKHVCQEFVAAGCLVTKIERSSGDLRHCTREAMYRLRDRLSGIDAHLVVNCAAYTDVDGAEEHSDEAFMVNAVGAEMVARAAGELGVSVCHISTDFVFDGGLSRPYDEFDEPRPLSVYGRSKFAGERMVRFVNPKSYIVRVCSLYGRGGRNFASQIVERLKAGQTLRLDQKRRCTPTWSRSLARQILTLCRRGEFGVYHASCLEETTWFGFAQALCDEAAALGCPLPRTFEGVDTSSLSQKAERPAQSVFDCRMLRMRGIFELPPWRDALRDYLKELIARKELQPR